MTSQERGLPAHRWNAAPYGETWVQCAKCHEWAVVGGRNYNTPCDLVDADLVERWLAHVDRPNARILHRPADVLRAIIAGEEPPA